MVYIYGPFGVNLSLLVKWRKFKYISCYYLDTFNFQIEVFKKIITLNESNKIACPYSELRIEV